MILLYIFKSEQITSMASKNSAAKTKKEGRSAERVARDSYTMPTKEHEQLAVLQQRCLRNAHYATKSELVRAGLVVLQVMTDKRILQTLNLLPKLKPGRRPK